MKIQFEDELIECTVHYGKSKKVSVHVDSFGFVTLKVPNDTTEEMIVAAIHSKGKWILEKKRAIELGGIASIDRQYHAQGVFLYLGEAHLLQELIEVGQSDEEEVLKTRLKKYYFARCKEIVEERIKIYSVQLKVKPKIIDIVESKTKWGSCSSDKKVTFNYRLAMAPLDVIDYVIIHELCHIHHMNHDRSFWRRVGSIMPDYKIKEEYLEKNGRFLIL